MRCSAILLPTLFPFPILTILPTFPTPNSQLPTSCALQAPLSPLLCSLTTALHRRCRGRVDILLFNPPYVPTLEEEEYLAQAHKGIAGAWAGGEYGTKLVQRLIQDGVVQVRLSPPQNACVPDPSFVLTLSFPFPLHLSFGRAGPPRTQRQVLSRRNQTKRSAQTGPDAT